jgi:hypothetical protein
MNLINDGIGTLINLAPVAALVSLVLAGLALRREGSFFQGARFWSWMFWAVVWVTLTPMLFWAGQFGIPVPETHQISTRFLGDIYSDLQTFVQQFLISVFAPVMAAWLVLRSVIDLAEGRSPLYSILAAMFLLTIPSTLTLLQGWNSGTLYSTTDVLAGLWTYTASQILPIAAGLAIIAAILNFAFGKPSMRLVCCAAGCLTVSGLWLLVKAMV